MECRCPPTTQQGFKGIMEAHTILRRYGDFLFSLWFWGISCSTRNKGSVTFLQPFDNIVSHPFPKHCIDKRLKQKSPCFAPFLVTQDTIRSISKNKMCVYVYLILHPTLLCFQTSAVCRIKDELNEVIFGKVRLWMIILFIFVFIFVVIILTLFLCSGRVLVFIKTTRESKTTES